MKRVLIITYYWPPSGGNGVQRWVKFVKYLQPFGWQPVVYTPSNPEYPSIDNSLAKDVPDNIKVLKNKITEPYSFYKNFTGKKSDSKINRDVVGIDRKHGLKEKLALWMRANIFIPDARMWWINPSVKFLDNYLKQNKVDVIISTGPPHSLHLIGLKIKQKHNIPWLADFRDPWTTMDYFDDLPLTPIALKRHHKLERKVLNTADHITCVGGQMQLEFSNKTTKPVSVLTNGFDDDDVFETNTKNENPNFILLHLGSFLQRRNPVVLWKALSEIISGNSDFKSKLKIKLIGRVEQTIHNSLQEFGLTEFVEEVNYISHDKVFGELNKATILLLPIDRFKGAKWVLTGKIFEYIVAHRFILCVGPLDGDAAAIINKTETGVAVDFDDLNSCKKVLSEQFKKFQSGNTFVDGHHLDSYSRKNLTSGLAGILNSIAK